MRIAVVVGLGLIGIAAATASVSAAPPLDYVPADTAVLFANEQRSGDAQLQAMQSISSGMSPHSVKDSLGQMRDKIAQALPTLDELVASGTPDDADEAATTAAERVRVMVAGLHQAVAVIDQLKLEMRDVQKWTDIDRFGVRAASLSAIYTVGLIPVLRTELADLKRFAAFVGRMEKASGRKMAQWGSDDKPMWALPLGPLVLLTAVTDGHIVVTVLPGDATAKERALLLDKPAKALGHAGLKRFNRTQSVLGYGSGYMDFQRLSELLVGTPRPLEQRMVQQLDSQWPQTSAVCSSEWRDLVSVAPRLVFGFTRLEQRGIDMRSVLELRPDLAAELQDLAGSAPPLHKQNNLASMSVAIDPLKAIAFAQKQAAAVEKQPYRCESLLEFNQSAASIGSTLQNLPSALLIGLRGLAVSIDHLEFSEDHSPTRIDVSAAVHSSQPSMVLGALQLSMPQIGEAGLEADGKPVQIDNSGLPPMFGGLSLVQTGTLLAAATGPEAMRRLTTLSKAKAEPTTPLLSMRFTGGFYGLLGQYLPIFTQMAGEDVTEVEALSRDIGLIAKELDTVDVRISFTGRGIEFYQNMNMAR